MNARFTLAVAVIMLYTCNATGMDQQISRANLALRLQAVARHMGAELPAEDNSLAISDNTSSSWISSVFSQSTHGGGSDNGGAPAGERRSITLADLQQARSAGRSFAGFDPRAALFLVLYQAEPDTEPGSATPLLHLAHANYPEIFINVDPAAIWPIIRPLIAPDPTILADLITAERERFVAGLPEWTASLQNALAPATLDARVGALRNELNIQITVDKRPRMLTQALVYGFGGGMMTLGAFKMVNGVSNTAGQSRFAIPAALAGVGAMGTVAKVLAVVGAVSVPLWMLKKIIGYGHLQAERNAEQSEHIQALLVQNAKAEIREEMMGVIREIERGVDAQLEAYERHVQEGTAVVQERIEEVAADVHALGTNVETALATIGRVGESHAESQAAVERLAGKMHRLQNLIRRVAGEGDGQNS